MSIEHLACVLHHSKASGTRKLVLLGIANHEGDGGSYPAIPTLAKYANVTDRNVQKAIDWLVGKGELRVHVQQGGGRDTPDHERTNRYEVLVACPQWCDHTPQHRDTRKLAGRQQPLWMNLRGGVACDTGGVSHATPGGVSHATPKPPTKPSRQDVVPVSLDTRACQDCGQGEAKCQPAQQAWPLEDRHPYRPKTHASR